MGKNPAFQFYPGDWFKDPELRSCSIGAKGAWFEILLLMSECKPIGMLSTDGVAWDESRIAQAIGGASDNSVTAAILELKTKGVLKRNMNGFFYSSRMLRMEKERKKWRKRQKKHRDNSKIESRSCHDFVTPLSRPSSSSSSSSTSIQKQEQNTLGHLPKTANEPTERVCLEIYSAYPKKIGKGDALKKIASAIKHIQKRPGLENGKAAAWLLESVQRYSESVRFKERQYIPNPATWFHQQRFDDPIQEEETYESYAKRAFAHLDSEKPDGSDDSVSDSEARFDTID